MSSACQAGREGFLLLISTFSQGEPDDRSSLECGGLDLLLVDWRSDLFVHRGLDVRVRSEAITARAAGGY